MYINVYSVIEIDNFTKIPREKIYFQQHFKHLHDINLHLAELIDGQYKNIQTNFEIQDMNTTNILSLITFLSKNRIIALSYSTYVNQISYHVTKRITKNSSTMHTYLPFNKEQKCIEIFDNPPTDKCNTAFLIDFKNQQFVCYDNNKTAYSIKDNPAKQFIEEEEKYLIYIKIIKLSICSIILILPFFCIFYFKNKKKEKIDKKI